MYLKDSLVELSFERLSSHKESGKTPLEKTSALMYFLAFDAAAKSRGSVPLDCNPKSFEGKTNRDAMTLEFTRLVQVKNGPNGLVRQISALGKIEAGGISPEKRISSNFLTVPLKKATQSSRKYLYPNRPAPVLKMGTAATGLMWGIDYCDDWKSNLPKLLSEAKSNTPFTDLAIVTQRSAKFEEGKEFKAALKEGLVSRFGDDLSTYWIKKIDAEKIFCKHVDDPFQANLPNAFSKVASGANRGKTDPLALRSSDQETLVNRVLYLEGLLDSLNIEY